MEASAQKRGGYLSLSRLSVAEGAGMVAGAIAPLVLAWIVARGHKLTRMPGEVTMIVGISAFILVICNGIILGKPDPNIEVGLTYGYLLALVASLAMAVCGFIRQATYVDAKKPPGVI